MKEEKVENRKDKALNDDELENVNGGLFYPGCEQAEYLALEKVKREEKAKAAKEAAIESVIEKGRPTATLNQPDISIETGRPTPTLKQ